MAFTPNEAMNLEQMLNRVRKYHPGDGYQIVEKAWHFAEKAHGPVVPLAEHLRPAVAANHP